MLPHLVPITKPSNGENPIVVSKDFPFFIAHRDAPFPKWQDIIFKFFISFFASSAAFSDTYLCDEP